ncbi:YbjN domain-containing protein [Tessaracoccus sp. OS52]|uniref:T3SS (YopN, CesT) and YbjN peptide-binding chaperone 1 n=1 Tax=Tessaracoccus sp. OS52 TaxID=2886691 RepID=UPI001D11F13C|nr:YbjN domain-containing protein [Tessaracoccus sp. OS52]MCC2593118.1 YbjN domain-containing protein [Tessaracoccus sp. OS52]
MADIEDFDFDRTTNMAWQAFTERLDEVLSVMDASADLTISVSRSGASYDVPPAIRFSMVRPGIVEATLLGPDDARLGELGWVAHADGTERVEVDQEESRRLAEITTATLSEVLGVLHPVFLEPDQLAELLSGVPHSDDEPIVEPLPRSVARPANQEELDAMVDEELVREFGHPPMRNADGDVAIRVGSTMIFLRTTPDARELLLFAALVHDVAGRSRACEILNDLNVEARYCRFALHRDRVFVQLSVFTQPFVPEHLRHALDAISKVADAIDDELATRLSGRTTFPG